MNSYHIKDIALDTLYFGITDLTFNMNGVYGKTDVWDYFTFALLDLLITNAKLVKPNDINENFENSLKNRLNHYALLTVAKTTLDITSQKKGMNIDTFLKNAGLIGGSEIIGGVVNAIRSKF